MKSSNYHGVRRIPFVLGLVLLSLIFSGCAYKNRKVDPEVKRNDSIKAPAAFAFIDANMKTNSYVPNVTITLIDPNGQVRTSSGTSFSEIKLKNGVMNLGLHSHAAVHERKPYRYRIKAEAPGYITTMETVLLTDMGAKYFPIYMVNLKNPSPSISTVSNTLKTDDKGMVIADTQFQTPPNDEIAQQFSFTIPKGTFLLCDGKRISDVQGDASIQLAYASPLGSNAGRTFPNGFLVTDAIGLEGETLATPDNPFLFASAGWISATIRVGEQEINGFSQEVKGTMGIAKQLINSETQKEFRKGDNVPIWSLNEETGNWKLEENALVENNNGELGVNFSMKHLSIWNVDQKINPCENPISVTVHNPTGASTEYYVEIVNARGEDMMTGGLLTHNVTFVPNDNDYTIINASSDIDMALNIYEDAPPSPLLAQSEVMENCNNPEIADILLPEEEFPSMCVNLKVTINDDNVHNNAVWYRGCPDDTISGCESWMEVEMKPWRYAGVLDNGNLTTLKIDPDSHTYFLFQIWYDNPSTTTEEAPIKFIVNRDPFLLAKPCGGSGLVTIEGTSSVSAITVEKKCNRDLSGSVPSCDIGETPCTNCPDTAQEITVGIQITM